MGSNTRKGLRQSENSLVGYDLIEPVIEQDEPFDVEKQTSNRHVLSLVTEYRCVRRHIQKALSDAKEMSSQTGWTMDAEEAFHDATAKLQSQLQNLIWELVEVPALTFRAICLKSSILKDLCDDHEQDIVRSLALSLCSDLKHYNSPQ